MDDRVETLEAAVASKKRKPCTVRVRVRVRVRVIYGVSWLWLGWVGV
jgi:hypothetical protein